MRARHRRAPVAKARYYGLASGGANQLPAATARAFTPSPRPPARPAPDRAQNYLSPRAAAILVLCRQTYARNANAPATFCRESMRHACLFCIFRNKKGKNMSCDCCVWAADRELNYHGVDV